MLWNTKALYQNSVKLFISSIQCKFQPSIFSPIDTLLRIFFLWVAEDYCLHSEASAFADQLLICGFICVSRRTIKSGTKILGWAFFSGKGILAEWRCANCKAITLLLGAASSANCKAIRSTRAPAIREGGLQWSPLWELAGFPQLYPLRSLFPSGNSLRPSQFCRWEVF